MYRDMVIKSEYLATPVESQKRYRGKSSSRKTWVSRSTSPLSYTKMRCDSLYPRSQPEVVNIRAAPAVSVVFFRKRDLEKTLSLDLAYLQFFYQPMIVYVRKNSKKIRPAIRIESDRICNIFTLAALLHFHPELVCSCRC